MGIIYFVMQDENLDIVVGVSDAGDVERQQQARSKCWQVKRCSQIDEL